VRRLFWLPVIALSSAVACGAAPGSRDATVRLDVDGEVSHGSGLITTDPYDGRVTLVAAISQDDGKIIVAGSSVLTDWDVSLVRYNVDGSLDTDFGGGDGIVTLDLGGNDFVFDVTLQSDGKIVVVGHAQFAADDYDFAVLRLNPNGTPDDSFSGDGLTTIAFDLGGDLEDTASDVAIQADGRIDIRATDDQKRRAHRAWRSRRLLGKPLSVLRLMKSLFTFDGGVDYALWKVERNTGVQVPISNIERRHPILTSPRLLWRVVRLSAVR